MLANELKQTKWDERIAPTPEEEYASLINVLNWTQGFGLVFVQCAPLQGEELIKRVRQDLPQKRIESMNLSTEIKNLYERVEDVVRHLNPNILFIRGIENSFVPYIKRGFGGQGDYYKLDSVPPILNHLNLQRERFRNSTQICMVFLLPLFGMKYFIQRAPDFFDWRSGLFEIPLDKDPANRAAKEICLEGNYSEYQRWSFSKRTKQILKIQAYLNEDIKPNTKAELYSELGLLSDVNEDYEEAIASYDHALEIKSDYHNVWFNRGFALGNLGRYEEAIASYDNALEFKPDYHEALNNRSSALVKLGRHEEAIASFDHALEINPDDLIAWYSLGNLGKHEEAIASFDRALEIKPDKYHAWFGRGAALFNLSRYEEAIASFDRALQIKPDDHEVWNNRGIALIKLGRHEEAIASFDCALEIKPNKHQAWFNRGNALFDLGRHEEAIASYEHAVEIKPNDATSFYNLACCYALQIMIDLALENLNKAINLSPEEYRHMAKSDTDFDNIRQDPRFQELIFPIAKEE
jgi:tetratricopeptide (TPR) repeat protein